MKQEDQIKRADTAYIQRLNPISQVKNRYIVYLQTGSKELEKCWLPSRDRIDRCFKRNQPENQSY